MLIIGISAKMGCGKTTLCNLLQQKLESSCVLVYRRSFATAVKDEVSTLYNIPIKMLYSQEGKATNIPIYYILKNKSAPISEAWLTKASVTVREIMQFYGTDYWRERDPDHWIKALWASISDPSLIIPQELRAYLIDDVRFPNELAFLLRKRALVYKILPYPEWQPGANVDHPSETSLDDPSIASAFSEIYSPAFGGIAHVAETIFAQLKARRLI